MSTKAKALIAAFLFTAAAPGVAVAAQKEQPAKPAGLTVSKEATAAIKALQTAAKENRMADIPGLAQAALAVAKTPVDRYFTYQLQLQPAITAKNDTMLLAAIEGMLSTGVPPQNEQANLLLNAAQLNFNANNYDKAGTEIDQAIALAPNESQNYRILGLIREAQKRPADAVAAFQKAAAVEQAAGKPLDPKLAAKTFAVAYNAHLPVARDIALAQLKASPNPESWRRAIKVYEQTSNLQAADKIDLFRLQRATGSLDGEGDYYPYVDALMTKGLPGEAKAVLDEAFAAGKLDKNKSTWSELYKSAVTRDAADKGPPNGDVYLGRGDYAKAAAAYRANVAKGGAGADLANLRLGIALARSGDKAGATAALNAVQGQRAGIAQMWLMYLNTQG